MSGPGEYNYQDPLGKGKPGLLCHKDLRFKPIDNKVPGPGAYTVSNYCVLIERAKHQYLVKITKVASHVNTELDETYFVCFNLLFIWI